MLPSPASEMSAFKSRIIRSTSPRSSGVGGAPFFFEVLRSGGVGRPQAAAAVTAILGDKKPGEAPSPFARLLSRLLSSSRESSKLELGVMATAGELGAKRDEPAPEEEAEEDVEVQLTMRSELDRSCCVKTGLRRDPSATAELVLLAPMSDCERAGMGLLGEEEVGLDGCREEAKPSMESEGRGERACFAARCDSICRLFSFATPTSKAVSEDDRGDAAGEEEERTISSFDVCKARGEGIELSVLAALGE